MTNRRFTPTSVRKLVDKFFSLQWCRDNFVVPLYEETSLPMKEGIIKIAIANYSYLGTIASPIKERLNQSGFKCEFVERSQEEIQEILDLASEERFIKGESIEISQFDEDAVLEAFKDTTDNEDSVIGENIVNQDSKVVARVVSKPTSNTLEIVYLTSGKFGVGDSVVFVDSINKTLTGTLTSTRHMVPLGSKT